jgi:hypothetical protein
MTLAWIVLLPLVAALLPDLLIRAYARLASSTPAASDASSIQLLERTRTLPGL